MARSTKQNLFHKLSLSTILWKLLASRNKFLKIKKGDTVNTCLLVFKATVQSCLGQTLVVSKVHNGYWYQRWKQRDIAGHGWTGLCVGLTLSRTCAVDFLLAFCKIKSTSWSNSFINHNRFSQQKKTLIHKNQNSPTCLKFKKVLKGQHGHAYMQLLEWASFHVILQGQIKQG